MSVSLSDNPYQAPSLVPGYTPFVCGLLYDWRMERIQLIHKTHPGWQAGKLNFVGGKVEKDETWHQAMVRESKEEVGSSPLEWKPFSFLTNTSRGGRVMFFVAKGDIPNYTHPVQYRSLALSLTEERVFTFNLSDVPWDLTIPNLQWLIPAAIWHLQTKNTEMILFSE